MIRSLWPPPPVSDIDCHRAISRNVFLTFAWPRSSYLVTWAPNRSLRRYVAGGAWRGCSKYTHSPKAFHWHLGNKDWQRSWKLITTTYPTRRIHQLPVETHVRGGGGGQTRLPVYACYAYVYGIYYYYYYYYLTAHMISFYNASKSAFNHDICL